MDIVFTLLLENDGRLRPPPQEDIQKSDEEIRVTAAGSVSVGALREEPGGSANLWRLILPN